MRTIVAKQIYSMTHPPIVEWMFVDHYHAEIFLVPDDMTNEEINEELKGIADGDSMSEGGIVRVMRLGGGETT